MVFLTSVITQQVYACDICGCGLGNIGNNLGQINTLQRKYLLLDHTRIRFNHPQIGNNNHPFDRLNRTKFTYACKNDSTPRWQWSVGIPIIQTHRHLLYQNKPISSQTNIGDLVASAVYTALDNRNTTLSDAWKSILQIQISTSIPNGRYQTRGPDLQQLPMHLQPGTGAWQGFSSANWYLSRKRWGFAFTTQLLYAGTNEFDYQIGQSYQTSGNILYQAVKSSNQSMILQTGLLSRNTKANTQYNQLIEHTGGQLISVFVQADWVIKQTYLRLRLDDPLKQTISPEAPKLSQQFQFAIGHLL